jgi:S1-C subfamily serine protease
MRRATSLLTAFIGAFLLMLGPAVVITASSPSIVFSGEPDEKLHKECLYPTVGIVAAGDQYQNRYSATGGATGTGFIVRSEEIKDKSGTHYHNVVITCEHVIRGKNKVKIRFPQYKDWSTFTGWKDYAAIIYRSNAKFDLAVLFFSSEKKMPVAEMDLEDKLYIGNDLFHIGAGMADQPRIDYGKVTSVNAKIRGLMAMDGYRVNCFMVPGDSGGPLFNPKNKVIGLAQALRSIPQPFGGRQLFGNFGFAIPITRVKQLDTAEFTWDHKKNVPVLPFYFLHAQEYEYSHFPGWPNK